MDRREGGMENLCPIGFLGRIARILGIIGRRRRIIRRRLGNLEERRGKGKILRARPLFHHVEPHHGVQDHVPPEK